MDIQGLNLGGVSVRFQVDECAALARLLQAGLEANAFEQAGARGEEMLCEIYASFFAVAAVAGNAQYFLTEKHRDDQVEQLAEMGLSRLVGIDDGELLLRQAENVVGDHLEANGGGV
jgi:hypothetical protein